VGDGPRKNELIQLAEKLGISENIDFVGFQTDVPYYYNSSKIFIHTSETEGLPNVVLEAMMCGLPCIVSNCGDILDIAKDGYNSLVIQKFDDYRGFANAIYNLLENDELYNNICRNALKITESVSIENVTQQWELILANNNFAKC
jgi:glycosyltransferase involved in cell wall biosynthesis